jgi:hypothetical protein
MSEEHSIASFRKEGGLTPIADGESDDLFLACASYEPRTLATLESFSENYRADKGVLYVNQEMLDDFSTDRTRKNLDRMKEILGKYCDELQVAMGSWLDPSIQLNALKGALETDRFENERPNVTIDISTFNREALLIVLNIIYNTIKKPNTRALYVTPESHGEWLSRGHTTIRNILGLTGLHESSKPTVLILLSGFEADRSLSIIEEFEPAKVLLGFGDPPTDEQFLSRNKREQEIIMKTHEPSKFEFPANDIKGSFEVIDRLIDEHLLDYNVVVAPMSTKLSTIGAWKAARKHIEVQVTYAIPGEYNFESYSEGASGIFIESIP